MKVSIITPNYNYGHYIGQTIESVVNQDYDNIEHIIIDDGSTDNSVEIIQHYAEKYPTKVKLVKQSNHGQTYSINTGLKHVSGDIIGWINSDDTFCQGAIKGVVETFKKHTEMDIVFGDLIMIDKSGIELKKRKQLPMDLLAGTFFGFGNIVASNTVFWKSMITEKIGYLKDDFTCNMDGEYFSRLFYAGKSIHINHYIANFRVHPQANSSDFNPVKMKKYEDELLFELKRSYSNLGISNLIPYKFSIYFKYFYRLKRIILRLLLGHYFA